jgi:cyanate permease
MSAILHLITALAGQSLRQTGQHMARVSVLVVLAMVFLMLGLLGFAVAGFILLARVMDPSLAALLMGAGCCLMAGILLLLARQPRAKPEVAPELQALLDSAGKQSLLVPLVLAVLGGFLATRGRR